MTVYEYSFEVDAPVSTVADFHSQTTILRVLTPPPLIIQVHSFGPMQEGMVARFTMWLGPLPLHWRARHINVGPNGFSDIQERGPLASWRHTHSFIALEGGRTLICEQVDYQHPPGLKGILTRLMFNKPGLFALFTYRRMVTVTALRRMPPDRPNSTIAP